MFFDDKPRSGGFATTAALGERPAFYENLGDVFSTSERATREINTQNALDTQIEEEIDKQNEAILKAGGPQLTNPMRRKATLAEDLATKATELGLSAFGGDVVMGAKPLQRSWMRQYDKEVADLVTKKPELATIVSSDGVEGIIKRRRDAAEKAEEEVRRRRGWDSTTPILGSIYDMAKDPLAGGAALAGGIWGQRYSPVDAAGMLAGFAQPMTKSLVNNALRNAGSNALVQLGLEPGLAAQELAVGRDRTLAQSAENVGAAFAMGGLLDLMVRAPVRAAVNRYGRDTPAGTLFSKNSPRGGFLTDVPDPVDLAKQAGVTLPPDIADLAGRIRNGDLDAARELIQRAGQGDNAELRGAIDRFELEGGDDPFAILRAAFEAAGERFDEGSAERRMLRALRSAIDPDEPPPVRGLDPTDGWPGPDPARMPDLSEESRSPIPPRVGTNQHVTQLDIMGRPARVATVDLKTAVDDLGDRVARATWNPEAGGRVLLFETTDGKLHIVDGHARGAIARASEGPADVEAVIFKETDGWVRPDVERLADAKNVREGRRSLLDVAEALRRDPDLAEIHAVETDFDEVAHSLAALSDEAWAGVRAGETDPLMAAMIADHVADPGLHAALLDDLKRAGISDIDEARRSLGALLPDTSVEVNRLLLGVPEDMPRTPLDGGADVDEPVGPKAKKQIERLGHDLAEHVAEAEKLVKEADKTRDLIVGLKRDIASLERHLEKAEANRFHDPETGETIPRSVYMDYVNAWKFLQQWKDQPRKPVRLTQFIQARGGLNDEGREVRHVIGSAKERPGLVNNKSGLDLDDAALMAWEQGYFTGPERPTIAEFLDRLDEDANNRGEPAYSVLDKDVVEEARVANEIAAELGRRGLDNARTRGEVAAYFTRTGEDGTAGDQAAKLQADLATKEQQLADAEDALASFERAGQGDQGLGRAEHALSSPEVADMVAAGQAVHIPTTIVDKGLEWLRPMMHMVPNGTNVGMLWRIVPGPAYADGTPSITMTFVRPDLSEFTLSGPVDHITRTRAFRISGEFTPDGRSAIGFLRFGRGDEPIDSIHSQLWHELGHELRSLGFLRGPVWSRLVRHAQSVGLLDIPAAEFLRLAGDPNWVNVADKKITMRKLYDELYRVQQKRPPKQLAEIMLQEEVSHFLELAARQMLPQEQVAPVADILVRISDGSMVGKAGAEGAAPLGHVDAATGRAMRQAFDEAQSSDIRGLASRDIDELGYYSQAIEEAKGLKQARGTPEQMLAQLKKAGVKDAEIEATGLKAILEGPSVTREQIISHLEGNRVGLREVGYDNRIYQLRQQIRDLQAATPTPENVERIGALIDDLEREISNAEHGLTNEVGRVKWARYSLDPSNPTYRETVLHLPGNDDALKAEIARRQQEGGNWEELMRQNRPQDFTSGHFSEPNIIGHMMTSLTTLPPRVIKDAEGHVIESGLVYTIDQIQSDWGQKLRDGGVRDEAKVAKLEAELAPLEAALDAMEKDLMARTGEATPMKALVKLSPFVMLDWNRLLNERNRVRSELWTAKESTSGHPLVNTTDQWVNTTLRRAIRQAAEANADYIAIPFGEKTIVDGYNPGDAHGMNQFYGGDGIEGIVPKNLRKLLQKIDKDSPVPQIIRHLDSPSGKTGLGNGFTLFPLTDKVKASVMADGQPMFALRGPERATPEIKAPETPAPQTEAASRLMALANRVLKKPDGGAERAVTERDIGSGLVNRVTVGEQTFDVERAPDGTVAGLREATPETTETLAAMVKQIGEGAGYPLDDVASLAAANRILDVARNLSANGSEPIARIMDLVQEMMTPPEQVAPLAQGPTPLSRDLAEIGRVNELAKVTSACRG